MRRNLPDRWNDIFLALFITGAGALFFLQLCAAYAVSSDAAGWAVELEAAGRYVYVVVASICLVTVSLRILRWLVRKDDPAANEQIEGSNT